MKRLILLMALVTAMTVLAPAAFADEAPDTTAADETMVTRAPAAQLWKAQIIADYFAGYIANHSEETAIGATASEAVGALDPALLEDVLTLRESVGWGALFKLMMYLAVSDHAQSIDAANGYGFGNLLRDIEYGEVKNLGQLQKSYRDEMPHKTPPGLEKSHENNGKGHKDG